MRNFILITLVCLISVMSLAGRQSAASEDGPMVVCKRALLPGAKQIVDSAGNTELHRAILRGDHALIAKLVADGAILNIRNSQSRTPLDLALLSEKDAVLLSFLKAVLHIPEQEDEITSGIVQMSHRLQLTALPESELTKIYGGSLMGYLVKKWRKNSASRAHELRDVLDYLQMQSGGLFIYQTGPLGQSGLYYAIDEGDLVAIDLLVREGLNPNYVGDVAKGVTQAITPAQLAFEKLQRAEHEYVMARLTEDPVTVVHVAARFAEAQAIWRRVAPNVNHRSATEKPLYQ